MRNIRINWYGDTTTMLDDSTHELGRPLSMDWIYVVVAHGLIIQSAAVMTKQRLGDKRHQGNTSCYHYNVDGIPTIEL